MNTRSKDDKPAEARSDQLVAPVPAVTFASAEAAHTVLGPIREGYESAATFAYAEWQQADQAQQDVDAEQAAIADVKRKILELQSEINGRMSRADQRTHDRNQHLLHAQQAADVANPRAVILTHSGMPTPPVARPLPPHETGNFMPPPSPLGELDGPADASMNVFLDQHAGIGQDGTR